MAGDHADGSHEPQSVHKRSGGCEGIGIGMTDVAARSEQAWARLKVISTSDEMAARLSSLLSTNGGEAERILTKIVEG